MCGSAFELSISGRRSATDDVNSEPRFCSAILAEATVGELPTKVVAGEAAAEFESFGM